MGTNASQQPTVVPGIDQAIEGEPCDVCGRRHDVAQVVCVMEAPEGTPDGLANLVFLCSFCGARIIQATTGFKAVRQLKSWYLVRERYPNLSADATLKVTKDDDWVG